MKARISGSSLSRSSEVVIITPSAASLAMSMKCWVS